jgi:hypothetical protein
MTNKRRMEREMSDLYCVIEHFRKNNQVVIERWTKMFNYSFSDIVLEFNENVDLYNKKYGKRWGMLRRITENL